MKTDLTPEEVTPDTISPEDALTLALTNKSFAKHVLRAVLTEGSDQDQAGGKTQDVHPTIRRRLNAQAVRENRVKASELKSTGRPLPARNNNDKGRSSVKPLWDGSQLREKLQAYNRTPFLDLLAVWMECAPTPQTIMDFADRYPDRWTKALLDLGRLGGFADRKEIDLNLQARIQNMSDSQLEDALREQAYRLGIPLPALLTSIGSRPSQDRQTTLIDEKAQEAVVVAPAEGEGSKG
jgi:hypothetical protein